ncbi:SRPBCC family protein [Microbacterium xylanilyticum]
MASFALERMIAAPAERVFALSRGPFAAFRHRHTFTPAPDGTLMRDEIDFRSPLGPLGRLVDALVMRRHLIRLIEQRNDALARQAEQP